MIPKIIHYCWLSNDPMPAELKRCIKSWKRKLPDYKIKKWDTHNFDIYSIPFVAEHVRCENGHLLVIIFVYMHFIRKGEYIWIQMFLSGIV